MQKKNRKSRYELAVKQGGPYSMTITEYNKLKEESVKKRKKNKNKSHTVEEQKDYGGHQIINVDGKYIRLPDYKEIVMTSVRVELKIKSVLHILF